ncbi:MAG: RNase adapter RapZ, partial [Acidimicrobiales bacterium]|nr:RNase adapter RapZ [Acidimicrobiales bacterium]
RILDVFTEHKQDSKLRIAVVSFGYSHGLPRDADLVLDCRFLPNPHWIPELRPHTGLDTDVRDYVLGQPAAKEFLTKVDDLLAMLLPAYVEEGKSYLTVAVGCTGGRHRSVAIAEELHHRIEQRGFLSNIAHRDVQK